MKSITEAYRLLVIVLLIIVIIGLYQTKNTPLNNHHVAIKGSVISITELPDGMRRVIVEDKNSHHIPLMIFPNKETVVDLTSSERTFFCTIYTNQLTNEMIFSVDDIN